MGLALSAAMQFDAIVFNNQLPDMDGLQLITALTERCGGLPCPVLVLADRSDENLMAQMFKAGVADYLVRDQLNPTLLKKALDGAIATARMTKRLCEAEQESRRQLERERLLADISLGIQRCQELPILVQTAVQGVRQLLAVDRALVLQLDSQGAGQVVAEAVAAGYQAILGTKVYDPCLGSRCIAFFRQGRVSARADVRLDAPSECYRQMLERIGVRASLVVPVLVDAALWGLLIAHQCDSPRPWHAEEIALMQRLTVQLGIALQQTELRAGLERQTRLFRTLVENSPDIIARLDRSQRYLYINSAITAVTARAPEDFQGRTSAELGMPAHLCALQQAVLQRVFETGNPEVSEFTLQGTDNQSHTYEWKVVPEFGQNGSIETVLSVARDISEQKRTQHELQLSREIIAQQLSEIESIYFQAPIGLCFLDTDLRFLRINEVLAQIDGISVSEHLGRTLRQVLPQMADELEPLYRQVIVSGEPILDLVVRGMTPAQPGVERIWQVSYYPHKDAQGQVLGINVVVQEITERKRLEEALAQRVAELQTLLEVLPVPVFIAEDAGCRTIRANPTGYALVGTPRATNVSYEPPPEQARPSYQILRNRLPLDPRELPMQRAGRTGERVVSERLDIVRTDGSVRHVLTHAAPLIDGQAKVTGVVCAMLDITELEQATATLRESEERFKLATDVGGISIWDYDLPSELSIWSRRTFQLLGYPIEPSGRATLQKWRDRLHHEDREQAVEIVRCACRDHALYTNEYRIVRANDGAVRWLQSFGRFLYDASGVPFRFIGISIDITDRKQLEAERLTLLERESTARKSAQQANRVKDEFLAMLSHELRTPLNPIIGWTQMLKRGTLTPVQQANALEIIERNAKLQNQLVSDLLDINRIERGKFTIDKQPCRFSTVVEQAVEAVRHQAETNGIELAVSLDASQSDLDGDPTRLQQMVLNLLTNAIKFTPRPGAVRVRLSGDERLLRLSVQDTGTGIEPGFLPYLFEHFRQADTSTTRKQGGLGLGLYLVRHIALAHSGRVWAESAGPGQGSTFFVELPQHRG